MLTVQVIARRAHVRDDDTEAQRTMWRPFWIAGRSYTLPVLTASEDAANELALQELSATALHPVLGWDA